MWKATRRFVSGTTHQCGAILKTLSEHLRRIIDGQVVRPLALFGPVMVLLIALPLLRPLRHPSEISPEESLRLATVRALVEQQSLALDKSYALYPGAVQTPTGLYSSQPPMMAVLLWAPAWLMTRLGYSFKDNFVLMAYILTLVGVTLPVAGAAGLVYRMGRLFELRRYWRAAMGFGVVAASGLLSYAVVLNPQAPAAALLIGAVGCLVHVAAMNRDDRRAPWFAMAGACAGMATTLDPAALVLLILLIFAIPTMRFSPGRRAAGMLLYVLGAIPIIAVHAAWNYPVTGDILPASLHTIIRTRADAPAVVALAADQQSIDEEDLGLSPRARGFWNGAADNIVWLLNATLGEHGLFSHFPILIIGILGIGAVMHRHWPTSTKVLAGSAGVGAVMILLLYRIARVDWASTMFANRAFLIFSPMLLFWAGAWLRRQHSPAGWSVAGVLLAFSLLVGLVGATDPMPRRGYDGYTAVGALARLVHAGNPPAPSPVPLAGKTP